MRKCHDVCIHSLTCFCRTDNKPTGKLDFELPYNSKLLLLAAYIASRNRPASDRKLFDNTAGKRRRKNVHASDRQVVHAHLCACMQNNMVADNLPLVLWLQLLSGSMRVVHGVVLCSLMQCTMYTVPCSQRSSCSRSAA